MLPCYLGATTIEGRIVHNQNGEPIAFAVIKLSETQQWTISDEEGYFTFNKIEQKTISLEVQHLSMQYYKEQFNISKAQIFNIEIKLKPTSFDVAEINVLAKKNQDITTSSVLEATALEHIQPTNLSDVMQLAAGNLIENPDLSTQQTISLREIGIDNNSALGTAIIFDGVPISNHANIQIYSTVVGNSSTDAMSTAGSGIDLRQFPTNNIEEVTILKGIASVEYGNMGSGAILVKTKTGKTPLEVKLKSDVRIKQMYVGKGLQLKKGGIFNANIDYTHSLSDLRLSYEAYDRISSQLGYSKVFFRESHPLSFNTKLTVHQTVFEEKNDPEAMLPDEVLQSSDNGARISIDGEWALDKKVINNLEYNFSGSVRQQNDYEKCYRSSGLQKISLTNEGGINEGIYIPSERLTELTIEGLPISFYAHIKGNKQFYLSETISNNIKAGVNFSYEKNHGNGRIYDITNPPVVNQTSSRPRSFKDIPALQNIALYIEDKTCIPIANTMLELQAGVRFNNFQAANLWSSDMDIHIEPRMNIRYNIINDSEKLISKLSIRAGLGINYMCAPLLYMYPDLTYFDLVELDHYSEDNPNTSLVQFKTYVQDPKNPDLTPSRNYKREIGFDFTIGQTTANLTAFRENLTQGFGMNSEYIFLDYTKYNDDDVPEGTKPNISTLPYEEMTYIAAYNVPTNSKETEKIGIEYDFNFGKIKPLATRIAMNGAWLKTKRIKHTSPYQYLPSSTQSGQLPYVGIYPAGDGTEQERMNTNFIFATHSPKLRLIFTTTIQVVWYEKHQQLLYNETPTELYDNNGVRYTFTETMQQDITYKDYIMEKGTYYFHTELLPPLLLCNFKLSKEFANHTKLSFYVNNFLNHRPTYQYVRSQTYTRRNPSIYFGAELMIKI